MKVSRSLILSMALLLVPYTKSYAEDCILTYKATTGGYTVTGATNGNTCTIADIPSTYNNQLVVSIANNAFYGSSIEELTLGNSVQTIGSGAFAYTNLSTVVVPDSVTSIGKDAFWYYASIKPKLLYCPKGLNCQVHQGATPQIIYEKNVDGSYQVNGKTYSDLNSICPSGHQCAVCGITNEDCWGDFNPETGALLITGNGAMTRAPWYRASNLKSVDIQGVTSIPNNAFYGSSMEELTLGNSVQTIGSGAFAYTNLSTVVVSDSVTSIGKDAFWYYASSKAKRIYCPEGLDCQTHGVVAKSPYSKVGDYYSMDGKMYRNLENMLKGIEMKRIYSIDEAIAVARGNKNTFMIRYR